jgi:subtilisin family serine protease
MMKHRFVIIALGVCLLLSLLTQPLSASKIHPQLAENISLSQDEYHKVIIRLSDRMNKERLTTSLSLTQYTRQAAHALAVNKLQSHAHATQENLVNFLESQISNTGVHSYKTYWIDNLIRAEVTTEILEQLSEFPEVEIIFPEIDVSSIPIETSPETISKGIATVGDNLKIIGADSMWALGYTGQGTIACTFDTGVEGIHPALVGNYRGSNGYSHEQCWFDPVAGDTFPHTLPQVDANVRSHGTTTMGVLIGKDDVTGDTIGVAFGAQWISAGVVDALNSFYLLDAFQWAADPDGDPNTADDIPDVLSNSWGYKYYKLASCEDVFHGLIDNLEALGVIVIFAAGNEGSGYRTLANPADRAENLYNTFAVGMIDDDYVDPFVHYSSSRGPSVCDPLAIKPNVVAPGDHIRASWPGSTYASNLTGTSYSCPHAAGAALLLRQYNPNAPVDSVKKALMLSATDIDEPGPDSTSGYGLINIPAALALMPFNDEPNLFVKSASFPIPAAGDTIEIIATLKNSGLGILNVMGIIRTDRTDITILDSSATFGDISLDSEKDNSNAPFKIVFSDEILEGTEISVDLYITGSGAYERDLNLSFLIGTKMEREFYTHISGNIEFTITNFGQYGVGPYSLVNLGGVGFVHPSGGTSNLWELGLTIANDSDHVSTASRTRSSVYDLDFKVAPEGNIQIFDPGQFGAQETLCKFNDDNANYPLGVEVTQRTFSYDGSVEGNFAIIMYAIQNKSESTLDDLRISILADWDYMISPYDAVDEVGFDSAGGVGYMRANLFSMPRGVVVLNDEGVCSFRVIHYGNDIWDGLNDAEKWQFATEGFIFTETVSSSDHSFMITTGPYNLAPGEIDTAAFAVIGADTLTDIIDIYAPAAKVAYTGILTDVNDDPGTPPLPDKFALYQNYPNPFNPSTVIEFDLQKDQHVILDIYNLLGQKIETLLDSDLPAGNHKVTWDTSESDRQIPSGVYFYRLKAGDQTSTKKMLLIK